MGKLHYLLIDFPSLPCCRHWQASKTMWFYFAYSAHAKQTSAHARQERNQCLVNLMCRVDFILCKIIRFKPIKEPVSVRIHMNTIRLSPIVTVTYHRRTYERSSRKKVWIRPVIFAGIPTMTIGIVLKKPIVNPKMLGKALSMKGVREDSAQIVISLTRECALVHGVINLAI